MAIVNRITAKTYFNTGNKPTEAQFGNFIDSAIFQEDISNFGKSLVSAETATSARTVLGAGTVGNALFQDTTQASAQNNIGGGEVGKNVFTATTTASAQQNIGGGAIGRQIFEATTTASAYNLIDVPIATAVIKGITYLQPNKNILINGAMNVDQRNNGSSQTITAGATLAYTVDQWYAYCTGANATGQRVAGTAPNQFNYRFTGVSSITKIGFAQRIEATNCQHLAGKTATLSVDLANSLLTTVTWKASYATTADTFGTIASPTITQIATGTFTVNSTLTRYATSIAIPAGAITGIEIEFSVGAQTSGTWTIGRAQFEDTPEQTAFEYKNIAQEIKMCQRYYEYGTTWAVSYNASGVQIQRCIYLYKVIKRISSPSAILGVLAGSLTAPTSVGGDQFSLWIAFGSTAGGIEGQFSIAVSAVL